MLLLLVVATSTGALLLRVGGAGHWARQANELETLDRARELLLARALATWDSEANRPEIRPGGLRCPDRDGDGSADAPGCARRWLGFFPWRSLRAEGVLRDRARQRLWYAVTPALADWGGAGHRINSDSVELNPGGWLFLDGQPVAALLIATGPALAGQRSRSSGQPEPSLFLEGLNADGSPAFARGQGNDRLLALPADELLGPLEERVLDELALALAGYRSTPGCGHLPWPAAAAGGGSVAGLLHGYLPLTLAAAPGGPTACPERLMPADWLIANGWDRLVRYAVAATGVECRAGVDCLVLRGPDGEQTDIAGLLILGGRALVALGQNRPGLSPADYFEGLNRRLLSPFEQRARGPEFNDRVRPVARSNR